MKKDTKKEMQNFYDWMRKMNNIHLADSEKMSNAFVKVAENC